MATPTQQQILEKALQQYHNDNPQAMTNPEYEELVESGYIYSATNELMLSEKRKHAEWLELEKPQDKQETVETHTEIPFNLESALATGVTLVGTRQCGKSTLAMQITDILRKKGIIVYSIDPTRVC